MLALLLLVPPPIDGEQAMAIARRFLRDAGHSQPYALNHLDEDRNRANRGGWRIGLESGPQFATVVLNRQGVVTFMSFGHLQTRPRPQTRDQAMALTTALGRKVAPGFQFRTGLVGNGANEQTMVDLDALVAGRPLFNLNPHYGLRVQCRGGQIVWYERVLNLPKPNATRARIPAEQALGLLRAYALKSTQDGIARLLKPDWPERNRLEAELGFYKFKDQPTARLVWRGNVFSAPQRRLGALRLYVDALTGKAIPPDDPSMG